MVGPSFSDMLDNIWEAAEGDLDFGDVKISFNVKPNMSKEQWKKNYMQELFKTDDFVQCPDGEILMPNLGII